MAITATAVKELRERTGAGMMDCKKALVETDGDLEKAAEYLQIKGIAKADKKADRVAAEGLVGAWVSDDGTQAGLVEVNCETDFVALNEEFQKFVDDLAVHVVSAGVDTVEALSGTAFGGTTVEETRKKKIASIGENVSIRRFATIALNEPGVVASYVHMGGKIGVLSTVNAAGDVSGNAEIAELARDIAMHIAASNPKFVDDSEIDDETIENERRILTEQALESGKPANIVDKMVEGRLHKWRKEICLLDQPFVKDPDVSVAKHIANVGKAAGVALSYGGFTRFERGEGIEKVESNLAAEVAAQMKQ